MRMNAIRTAARPPGISSLLPALFVVVLAGGDAMGADLWKASEPPTYTKDVAPILQAKCQGCHRKNQAGPFPLETYEHARKRAKDIAAVVEERSMPPWKPASGVGPKLKHDRSASPEEMGVLKAWALAGAPKGKQEDHPPARRFVEGWALGTPDLVLEPLEDFPIPASGRDVYRCFVIPTKLPQDVYISAIEYRAGNGRVVHHMMAFVDVAGGARQRDAAESGPGYTSYSGPGVDVFGDLGGWAAGNEPNHLPEGVGRALPQGADVILQVHYHPSGKAETDRSQLGLHFARRPVKQTLHWNNASSEVLKLEPGQSNIEVKAKWFVPVDVDALAVTPHMHQLGRDMRITVTLPGGRTRDLIYIPDWDPAWQSTYYFEKPISLPKGSIVNIVAHFDNSAHPRNPHQPPKLVRWGHEVTDEMCIGYIGVVKKGQDLTRRGEKDDLFEIFVRQRQKQKLREEFARRNR